MMAAAALGVFLLFLLVAFGARSWIHYRRTGDHGIRLRASGPVARLAGLLLLTGIALGGLAPVVELLGIFTAVLIATAGLVLAVPNPVSFAALVCVFLGLEMQVRWIEEPYLSGVHGTSYRSYARTVGRFLPGIGRLR